MCFRANFVLNKIKIKTSVIVLISVASIFLSTKANCQILPDSVVILKKTYVQKGWNDSQDSIYSIKKVLFKKDISTYESDENSVDQSVVSELIQEIDNNDNRTNILARYKIDTTWIKNNPAKVLALSPYAKRFSWNKQQTELIYPELVKIKNYNNGLDEYLANGCCYTMHNYYRTQLIVKVYDGGLLLKEIDSRKYVWGYKYPWTDAKGNRLFSFKIEALVDLLLNSTSQNTAPLSGRKFLKQLVDRILEMNSEKLYQLAPYSYEQQINELKTTFKVVYFSEMTGYGGYHGDGPLIQIILKNDEMLSNLSVEFLASITNGSLYSRDSLKKDYKALVNKIQSIKFITNYLSAHPDTHLNILYFDNRPINQYNIESVNGKPAEWQNQDEYIQSLKWYQTNNINPSFDISAAIKTSEHNYCGCNYRFSNNFIGKAIMFIIDDKDKDHSRWLLLPDNTLLLFLMTGKHVLDYNYTDFGKYPGLQYPCIRFDLNGVIIPKKQ